MGKEVDELIMKHKISETGARMLKYQEQLADEYKYKPIPRTFFKDVRAEFEETLPEWCNMSGDTTKLETRSGTVIASGYNRIVIGDYGAFVEFSRAQANARHLKIKEGQSYRIEDPRYDFSRSDIYGFDAGSFSRRLPPVRFCESLSSC